MEVADNVALNPVEAPVVPQRVEHALWEMGISVVGADWGDSGVEGTTVRGAGLVDREPKLRTIVLSLAVRPDAEVDLPTAAHRLQQSVGSMQERISWIRRDFMVAGDFAGSLLYRVSGEVTLSPLGNWQAGDSQPVTLTMVADFAGYSTTEDEVAKLTAATARHFIYTADASNGSARGRRRIQIENANASGDWRGLIWAEECWDAPDELTDPTALLAYEAQKLTPKGPGAVKEVSSVKLVEAALTAGWQSFLGTFIVGTGHMTHRGGRRPWLRIWDPGATPGNIQLRLVWRALGGSRWVEDNPIVSTQVVGNWSFVNLGAVLPQVAALGDERWEGKLMGRALSGTGSIRVRDFYPAPTEQYMVLSESEEAAIDGEPAKAPGTVEDATGVGTVAWTNPSNAKVADGSPATALLPKGTTSHYLKATNFGFAIPTGAAIQGIRVAVLRRYGLTGFVRDERVRIVKAGTIKETEDKARSESWSRLLFATALYGGPADLWGNTWAASDINSSGFGIAISAVSTGVGEALTEVDAITITVAYVESQSENRVCFATKTVELRSDGAYREAPEDDVWGRLVEDGFLPYSAPGGLEGRNARGILIPTQGDLEARADSGTNKAVVTVLDRSGHLYAREAT